jgi:hypothetical protein
MTGPGKAEVRDSFTDCDISSQFLTVSLQKGELHRLKLDGVPHVQARAVRTMELKRVPDPPKISAKLISIPAKHQIVLDCGKKQTVSGVLFRDFHGAQSVIFAFCPTHWDRPKKKPAATDYFYLPDADSQFRLRFTVTTPVRYVHIHFCDLQPGFVEPKAELF